LTRSSGIRFIALVTGSLSSLLFFAQPASATGPLTLQTDARRLMFTTQFCPMPPQCFPQIEQVSPNPAFSVFNQTLNSGYSPSTASQNSTVSQSGMSGTGASLYGGAQGNGSSTFSVTFYPTVTSSYSFSGQRIGLANCVNCDDVYLYDNSTSTYLVHPALFQASGSFSSTGTLFKNHQYTLSLGSDDAPGTQQSWNFTFTAAALPGVPFLSPWAAALLAVLLGAVSIAGARAARLRRLG